MTLHRAAIKLRKIVDDCAFFHSDKGECTCLVKIKMILRMFRATALNDAIKAMRKAVRS